jgi:hypothetical protein
MTWKGVKLYEITWNSGKVLFNEEYSLTLLRNFSKARTRIKLQTNYLNYATYLCTSCAFQVRKHIQACWIGKAEDWLSRQSGCKPSSKHDQARQKCVSKRQVEQVGVSKSSSECHV